MSHIGLLFAILTAFTFSLSSVVMKKGLSNATSQSAVLFTLIVNVVMFLTISLFIISVHGASVISPEGVLFFTLSGIFGPILGRFVFFGSINRVGVTRTASIKITAPVFSAILAWFFLKEILSFSMIFAIFVIIFGVYLVIISPRGNGNNVLDAKIGFLLAFLSAFFFAVTNVFRKAGLLYIESAIIGSAISTVTALFIFLVYCLVKRNLKESLVIDKASSVYFLIGGVFSGIAVFSYFMSLKFAPVSVAMALANVEPLFTIGLIKLFQMSDEPITLKFFIGAVSVIAGVVLLISA